MIIMLNKDNLNGVNSWKRACIYKEQISLTNSNHIRENLMEIISQDR